MSRASRSSRLRWLAHPRPRAKPVEIAPGQSCDLCIQVQICNERSTERCANIASKSCNGFVHLRFKQGSGAGSRSVERSGAFTFGLALFIIRTKEELRVNGDPMGRGEGELTAAAIDHGRPHQVAVPARTVGSWKLSALLCRCVKRHHSVFHEDQWWIEAGKDVPATLLARTPRYSNT
jgi:hypothetical protein